VKVGNAKHLLKATPSIRESNEPGIPLQDALTATEKLILEKKPHAIALGNFRSEVLLASWTSCPSINFRIFVHCHDSTVPEEDRGGV